MAFFDAPTNQVSLPQTSSETRRFHGSLSKGSKKGSRRTVSRIRKQRQSLRYFLSPPPPAMRRPVDQGRILTPLGDPGTFIDSGPFMVIQRQTKTKSTCNVIPIDTGCGLPVTGPAPPLRPRRRGRWQQLRQSELLRSRSVATARRKAFAVFPAIPGRGCFGCPDACVSGW